MRQSNLFFQFFKMLKFFGKIIGHIRMFHTEMFSNRGRRILVLVYALMQMPPRVTNTTCITQVTFELINKGLLVDNRRLAFAQFQMLFDLVVDKRGLDGFLNFLAQIQPIL